MSAPPPPPPRPTCPPQTPPPPAGPQTPPPPAGPKVTPRTVVPFRTQRARDLAQRDPAAGAVIAQFAASLPPLSDEQGATIRRALPPHPAPHQHAGRRRLAAAQNLILAGLLLALTGLPTTPPDDHTGYGWRPATPAEKSAHDTQQTRDIQTATDQAQRNGAPAAPPAKAPTTTRKGSDHL